jgi:glycosyltransferase involved in cell wall biosynthesis
VPGEELLGLYRTASALVFPSLYEGFGLPPLEAMASGCPVASSNAGALPEVLADAPAYFDPNDPEAIAAAVSKVLADPRPFAERGLARACAFTWDACARKHDDVYEELSVA